MRHEVEQGNIQSLQLIYIVVAVMGAHIVTLPLQREEKRLIFVNPL